MFQVPVSYLFDFEYTDDRTRPYMMHEFAVNGARHLVLTDALIGMMMRDHAFRKTLLKEMEQEGLSFCDAHAPFGLMQDLNCPDPAVRPQMLLRQKLALRITADMGITTIAFHTGNEVSYPDCPLEIQYDMVKRSLAELLPYADSLGLTICLENIWFRINTADRLLGIKKEFPTDVLGFCYDSGHANLMSQGRLSPDSPPYKAWGGVEPEFDDRILEKMLPHVVNCHLHDNNGRMDQHLKPGRGSIDWPHIIGLLKKAPRLKVIQSEVIPIRNRESVRDICEKFVFLGNLPEGDQQGS